MILRKWNYKTHKYEPYEIPDEWNCKVYTDDMDEDVNCPHCGKKFKFGCGFTSKEIHTRIGFGYCVCYKCYQEEWKRKESDNNGNTINNNRI